MRQVLSGNLRHYLNKMAAFFAVDLWYFYKFLHMDLLSVSWKLIVFIGEHVIINLLNSYYSTFDRFSNEWVSKAVTWALIMAFNFKLKIVDDVILRKLTI
jgi:hypothetical protein